MACVAGIALINFSVSRLRGESSVRKVAPIASALCCASTGIAVLLVEDFSLNGIVSFLADCVLAGGMTYFFSRSLALIDKRKETRRLGRRDIICVAISCCAALAALAEFDIMNFRPAGTADNGYSGDCFTVLIQGQEKHLFFEHLDPRFNGRLGRWFVERTAQ